MQTFVKKQPPSQEKPAGGRTSSGRAPHGALQQQAAMTSGSFGTHAGHPDPGGTAAGTPNNGAGISGISQNAAHPAFDIRSIPVHGTQRTAVQTKPAGNGAAKRSDGMDGTVAEAAAMGSRATGQPMEHTTRSFMESRFGSDFSGVRVHADNRAARAARSLEALAYTTGNDIVFGGGRYQPETPGGRHLLAHELTHVVQQRGGVHLKGALGRSGDVYEQQAETVADHVTAGRSVRGILGSAAGTMPAGPVSVQRQQVAHGRSASQDAAHTAPNLSEAEVIKWPQVLPKAVRGKGKELTTTLHSTATAPSVSNAEAGVDAALTEQQKKIVEQIRINRSAVDTAKLKLVKYKSAYGYAYGGTSSFAPTETQGADGPGRTRESEIKKAVWDELKHEGGTSSINAYDSEKVTWGHGFGGNKGSLPVVMDALFKDADARKAFLVYGIDYQSGWHVVNTANGGIESGQNAVSLIQASPDLLGVFIKIAETGSTEPSKNLGQKVTDAQWVGMTAAGKAGDVPKWAYDWDLRLIQFVAHLTHWGPVFGWSAGYQGKGNIHDVLMRWGEKAAGLKSGAKPANGALIYNNADTINNFRKWGGGIAWDAIRQVTPDPLPYSGSQLTKATNTQFKGLVCILASNGRGYYFYPSRPAILGADGKKDPKSGTSFGYDYLHVIDGRPMDETLKLLGALSDDTFTSMMDGYDGGLGGRPRIAMKASAISRRTKKLAHPQKGMKKEAVAEERKAIQALKDSIETDADFTGLKEEKDRTAIRTALGIAAPKKK
ncbi:MAG: DUF4157 domain-containing protein [Bacteroidetes bacterium]|nr:DUF4157 domain-containing protein [Bacteroidota bacterium]